MKLVNFQLRMPEIEKIESKKKARTKMPKVGNKDFNYTPQGIAEAEAYSDATGLPVINAPDTRERYQWGGMVLPPTGGQEVPASPIVGEGLSSAPSLYKKGGKVDVTDVVKTAESLKKRTEEYDKEIAKEKRKGPARFWDSPGSKADYLQKDKAYSKMIAEGQIGSMKKVVK